MASLGVLNVNVGILGHVDSGKTSLAKALSTVNSTACFDKHPQSQEQGITLDLGFSAFMADLPEHIKDPRFSQLQFTLVDCPGHASLIRTIIGGAHIIQIMMLVIDINEGIQTQTAECIVIGELMTDKLVIVLNKVDMIPEDVRADRVEKMKAKLSKTFKATRFADAPMVVVAADPGAGGQGKSIGMQDLINLLRGLVPQPESEASSGPLYFAIDHCFPIKGQGTVITGTVLQGSVEVNQTIEFPELKLERKVKSMQMFRKPVNIASKGDRVGICVTQLDAKAIERGVAAAPHSVPSLSACIVRLEKIRFHKHSVTSRSKLHITVGHTTVMGTVYFFRDESATKSENIVKDHSPFSFDKEYLWLDELLPTSQECVAGAQLALIEFATPVTCPLFSIAIGSRLDTDVHTKTCRLAFYGSVLTAVEEKDKQRILAFKNKQKEARVDRVTDENNVIGKDLITKGKDITAFVGLKLTTEKGVAGKIDDSFGKSGKFKARFSEPHGLQNGDKMILNFKKYVFDPEKSLKQ
eukprot:c6351_g1_i1.p1 GENE.c6351_g1_i1~~c6351_g1_i1.p1  ORF type:complete len:572 (-),score=148.73 c6351_g1_i1:33-1607(-)